MMEQQYESTRPSDQPEEENKSTENKAEDSTGESGRSESGLKFRRKKKDDNQDQLQALQREAADAKDKYLRLYADYDNFRRRTAKEKLELNQTASAEVIRDLLPVLDDMERAIEALEKTDGASTLDGVRLIYGKMLRLLEQKGLKVMEAKGNTFDTDLHDALAQIPAPSEDLKGKIVDVLEKGYMLNDKVIRHAKVVVGV
jgi:molecular chaperone GrpE